MKIHREGRTIIVTTLLIVAAVTTAIACCCGFGAAFWLTVLPACMLVLFTGYFFRVPARVPVASDDAVVAAADGTVVIVEEADENEYLKTRCMQVSIFMSVFDVHANYFPVSGTVEYVRYHAGKYMVAWHPKSSEKNERTTIVVNHAGTPVLFRQIAGLIARRIVCYAREGEPVQASSEAGFIKFGSRVDIFLPLGTRVCVKKGDKVKARQTVIATLNAPQPPLV